MTDHNSFDQFFNNQLYSCNKKSLLMIGRWPYQNKKWRVIILCLIMLPITFDNLGEVIYLVEVSGDTDVMLKSLLGLAVSYSACVMLINSIVNFNMMKEILEIITNNWMQLKNRDEKAIFLKEAMEGKSSILVYLGFMIGGAGIFVLQPFMSELVYVIKPTNESHPLKPILDAQFYIDPTKYYVPIYLHCATGTILNIMVVFTLDAHFIMMVHHACGMYDVLSYRIEMINQKNTMSFSSDEREKLIFENIIKCIKYHRDCMRFSGLIEKFSNISWLMLVTSIVFGLSISAVQTIIKIHELEEMFTFGLCSVCAATRLFYISLAGQKITDHSVQIHQFIYNISWYELPPKATKLLIPMLVRASRPSDITMGKLMPLNLHTFCSLMKVSTSYFTFILSTL